LRELFLSVCSRTSRSKPFADTYSVSSSPIGSVDHFTYEKKGLYELLYHKELYCDETCSEVIDGRGIYSTDLFTDRAIDVIENHTLTASDDNPLFLYLPYLATHSPLQAPQEFTDLYKNRNDWSDNRQTYAGMITSMDYGISRVIAALQESGMWEDTLIMFMSDNGGPEQHASNAPRRGGKGDIWEGGVKVDGIVGGPARSKLGILGGSLQSPFHIVDIFPTISAMVGAPRSGALELDGMDQTQALTTDIPVRTDFFVGYNYDKNAPDWYDTKAVRSDKWKLAVDVNGTSELYNLDTDISEETDRAATKPSVLTRLTEILAEYEALFTDPIEKRDSRCKFRNVTVEFIDETSVDAVTPWCDYCVEGGICPIS